MTSESRRTALINLLRDQPDVVPISDLAEHFGVTVRTILRDASALREAGHAITGSRGRGGGLKLEWATQFALPQDSDRPSPVAHASTPASIALDGVFVGRHREIEAIEQAFAETVAGTGRVFMLAGEPGIGKTRVAQRASSLLGQRGALVLWGRCYESDSAPPYWPWAQVIRAYAATRSTRELQEEMGEGASDIAEIVPDLYSQLPGLKRPSRSGIPDAARFRLFQSVQAFLERATQNRPLVLVLEDLHEADTSSLQLLEFVAQEISNARLLLIGTYRDMELNRRHPLARALGEMNRLPEFNRIALKGLLASEVGEYLRIVAEHAPPDALVQSLYEHTEGNPLYVTEIVNLLRQEGALTESGLSETSVVSGRIPEGVREVIGRRLDQLSPLCNTLLTCAAVIGREFTLHGLRRVADAFDATPSSNGGSENSDLLQALQDASQARILERVSTEIGGYRFTHAIIRATLYDELTTPERVRLHRMAGEAIEALHFLDLEPHLPQLAHHFLEAAQGGDSARAVEYASKAGERAVQMVAYEDAIGHFRMALQALQLDQQPDELRRCHLLMALGEALRLASEYTEATRTYGSAAQLAKRIQSAELLAEAAIGVEEVGWRPGFNGAEAASLLREALQQMEPGDSQLRARALASLGRALNYSGAPDDALHVGQDAIQMARRLGDDVTLALVLTARLPARWIPQEIDARIAMAGEALRIAERIGNDDLAMEVASWRINDLLEVGDIDGLAATEDSWVTTAFATRDPFWVYSVTSNRAQRAILHGEFTTGEELAREALEIGQGMRGMDAMGIYGVQMFTIRREQGGLKELRPTIETFVRLNPESTWRPGLAVIYADLEMREEARAEFDRISRNNFALVPRDGLMVASLAYLAEVAEYLDDGDAAAGLYKLLAPYDRHNLTVGVNVVCLGSSSMYLGLLASVMSDWDAAERFFEDAYQMNERMGARPSLAHTQFSHSRMLVRRSKRGDRERAEDLRRKALLSANELGMRSLALRISTAERADETPVVRVPELPDGLTSREVEVLRHIAMGKGNREIAYALVITSNTVANHVKSILSKTGSANRTEAAAYAVREQLV